LVHGQSYALDVVGSSLQDGAGNVAVAASGTDRVSKVVDDKNAAWRYRGTWKRVAASSALGGTFTRGTTRSTATVKLVGGVVKVYACKAPKSGKMRIMIDGVVKAKPSLAQSFTSCGVLVYRGSMSTSSVHTLQLKAVHGAVDLDRVVG
jgi:hypothetical protein